MPTMSPYLWDGPGRLATSNAQQVQRIVSILKSLNLEVATPEETRRCVLTRCRRAQVPFRTIAACRDGAPRQSSGPSFFFELN